MAIRLASDATDTPELAHEINVTPFIDVMLVLLIIFMVAAPLATVDVKVDLPAATARPAPAATDPVTLTIRADGQRFVGDRAIDDAGLASAIIAATGGDRDARIHVRADARVTYDGVMRAMNALRGAGYLKIALVGADQGK